MTTSNATTFNPSIADIFLEAYSRIGIPPPAIQRHHISQARRSINYELLSFSNKGVNLWAVDQQQITLVQGQSTYVGTGQGVPPDTVTMLDVYFSLVNGGGPGVPVDRIMIPMGRTEYDEIPNKQQQGTPTRFWFQKTIPRQVTIWEPPDASNSSPTAVINYHRLRRLQDASPLTGQTADVDALFLDALADALSVRLARKLPKDTPNRDRIILEAKAFAKESWEVAITANREDVPTRVYMNVGGYYPR